LGSGPSQGLYMHGTTERTATHAHAPSRILTERPKSVYMAIVM